MVDNTKVMSVAADSMSNRMSVKSKEIGHTGGAGTGPNGSHHCHNPDLEITD